ncbi:MAG TPA: ATP-dependent sacrificial sulfur transferase LarE [Bacteroidales bacterium]
MIENVKFNNLLAYLRDMNSVAVAFSGGTDSTFLLKACQMALKENVLAISMKTPYIPGWEIEEAVKFARENKIRHKLFDIPFLHQLKENRKDRCYWCKTHLFRHMLAEAKREGFTTIIDGTNFDDLQDYRPGLQALKELQIKSPLLELRFTKAEIRRFSQELGLPTWEKPAYACLLTRIPYGQEISNGELKRIEEAEKYLRKLGFEGSRVRIHGNLARIEIQKNMLSNILNTQLFEKISRDLKDIGFTYITLDMEGYRTGSHNESL